MEAIAAQVQALKSEGNAQFQQKSFMGAAQKYTAALALLEEFAGDAESLRTPLLLNRAWANLETRDVNLALQAEDDCSQVLLTQSMCVKALYRRALARELLGNIQGGLDDVRIVLHLEPSNPSALQLFSRLDAMYDESLRLQLQRCAVSRQPNLRTELAVGPRAASAWEALQNEEQQLLRAYTSKTQRSNRKSSSDHVTTATKQAERRSGEILKKTDELWLSLTQEEEQTVAKAYRSKASTKSLQNPRVYSSSQSSITGAA